MMTRPTSFTSKLWWLVHKDLVREFRARIVWPSMLLLGFVIVLTLELQMDLPAEWKHRVAGGMLWLAVFFAGTISLERSLAGERDEGCWDALRAYPVSASVVYLAKVLFNFITLTCVSCVLIPAFVVLTDAPLFNEPVATLLIALIANLGLAAVGTLISGLTNGMRRRGNMIVLLLLPLVLPVVLGASAATSLMIDGELGAEFWRWLQLLTAFAVVFITAGILLFELVMEG